MKFYSESSSQTENLGKQIASKLKGNEVIAFYGDLGAGKTTLTRGIADFFNLKNKVCSPTFAILNEYESSKVRLYHFDMYRIASLEDLESTGFFDYLGEGVFIIEWSENIDKYLPKQTIKIKIEKNGENSRIITIEGADLN